MKMKFCAVSLSLPPLESGESIGAFQRAIISEEIRVFKALVPSDCRHKVQKKVGRDGRSGLYVVLSKACLVPSQRVLRHNGSADHL